MPTRKILNTCGFPVGQIAMGTDSRGFGVALPLLVLAQPLLFLRERTEISVAILANSEDLRKGVVMVSVAIGAVIFGAVLKLTSTFPPKTTSRFLEKEPLNHSRV